MTTLLSAEQLRQQIRVRLAQRRLFPASGVYRTRRGRGQPCLVCRRDVGRTEVECEVGGAGVVLVAHEACYMLWREESVIYPGSRTVPACPYCGSPIREGERRYRDSAGDCHVECRDTALRRGSGW
jgi:hypothetical protein